LWIHSHEWASKVADGDLWLKNLQLTSNANLTLIRERRTKYQVKASQKFE